MTVQCATVLPLNTAVDFTGLFSQCPSIKADGISPDLSVIRGYSQGTGKMTSRASFMVARLKPRTDFMVSRLV